MMPSGYDGLIHGNIHHNLHAVDTRLSPHSTGEWRKLLTGALTGAIETHLFEVGDFVRRSEIRVILQDMSTTPAEDLLLSFLDWRVASGYLIVSARSCPHSSIHLCAAHHSMMSSALCVGGVPVTVRKSSSLICRPQPSHALIASAPRQLAQRGFNDVAAASDDTDTTLSGEWPVTLALASYEVRRCHRDAIYSGVSSSVTFPNLPSVILPSSTFAACDDSHSSRLLAGQRLGLLRVRATPMRKGRVSIRVIFARRMSANTSRTTCSRRRRLRVPPFPPSPLELSLAPSIHPTCLPVITTFCHAHSADRRRGRRAGSLLQDIMSKDLSVTTPDASLAELKAEFGAVSGLPVVKDRSSMVLVGVVSRKDLLKAGGTVADVRTQPRKPCPFLRNG